MRLGLCGSWPPGLSTVGDMNVRLDHIDDDDDDDNKIATEDITTTKSSVAKSSGYHHHHHNVGDYDIVFSNDSHFHLLSLLSAILILSV